MKNILILIFSILLYAGCQHKKRHQKEDAVYILVAIVVFVFLGDFRSTLIPVIAVPISLVGAFIFMSF